MLEYFGAITGLVYVALEIKQHRAMWVVGFITSLVYVFVFFSAKVYAYMGLQVYYVVISVYGYWLWRTQNAERRTEDGTISYSHVSLPLAAGISAATGVVCYLLYYLLSHYTDSPVPVGDALTTALGIVATWMLARRIIEHWYLWIVANTASVYIYYLLGLYPTMFLYLCYAILSGVGLYMWRKKGRPETGGRNTDRNSVSGLRPPASCIIIANGQFPQSPQALEILGKAAVVIACDGAITALHRLGIRPKAIVGDQDSIPPDMREQYADRLIHDADQETNDLTKAVHFARQSGEKEVIILGATGKREDHTLGNISLLADYAPLFERVEMLTDYGLFTPITETTTFDSWRGQQVSIFSLSPEGEITTEGLRWPIHERKLTSWWEGTLNEALGDRFTIRTKGPARIIVYRVI